LSARKHAHSDDGYKLSWVSTWCVSTHAVNIVGQLADLPSRQMVNPPKVKSSHRQVKPHSHRRICSQLPATTPLQLCVCAACTLTDLDLQNTTAAHHNSQPMDTLVHAQQQDTQHQTAGSTPPAPNKVCTPCSWFLCGFLRFEWMS